MTERDPALEPFAALIGTWTTETTHPQIDAVVPGTTTFEWLGGFVAQRTHLDHERFPDSIAVIGPGTMEYFDTRGVRRTYAAAIEDGVLRLSRDAPGFDQRFSATLAPDAFEGLWQVAETPGDWRDDVRVRYRRRPPLTHLYAGVPVSDLDAAIAWYGRLFDREPDWRAGDEVLWAVDERAWLFVEPNAEHAGSGRITIGVTDLDALLARLAAAGIDHEPVETYANGVRHAKLPDPDGNAIAFAEPPS